MYYEVLIIQNRLYSGVEKVLVILCKSTVVKCNRWLYFNNIG